MAGASRSSSIGGRLDDGGRGRGLGGCPGRPMGRDRGAFFSRKARPLRNPNNALAWSGAAPTLTLPTIRYASEGGGKAISADRLPSPLYPLYLSHADRGMHAA